MVTIAKNDGSISKEKITKIFINEGIHKKEVNVAFYGDIVTVAGCPGISIGDTIYSHRPNCMFAVWHQYIS